MKEEDISEWWTQIDTYTSQKRKIKEKQVPSNDNINQYGSRIPFSSNFGMYIFSLFVRFCQNTRDVIGLFQLKYFHSSIHKACHTLLISLSLCVCVLWVSFVAGNKVKLFIRAYKKICRASLFSLTTNLFVILFPSLCT